MAGSPSTRGSRRWSPTRRRPAPRSGLGLGRGAVSLKGAAARRDQLFKEQIKAEQKKPQGARTEVPGRAQEGQGLAGPARSTRWTWTSRMLKRLRELVSDRLGASGGERPHAPRSSGRSAGPSTSRWPSCPRAVRPTVGLAYLFARAADTIADTRLIDAARAHRPPRGARAPSSTAGAGRPPRRHRRGRRRARRSLRRRARGCSSACPRLRRLSRAGRSRSGARAPASSTRIIEGMTEDLRVFPGENEGKLAALETRADLDRYTYLVAGCVGEFWTDVHVAHRPRLAPLGCPGDARARRPLRQGRSSSRTCCATCRATCAHGRCYLPRAGPGPASASSRAICSIPPPGPPRARCCGSCSRPRSTTTTPGGSTRSPSRGAETRMRLACAWPLLIGLATLDLLAAFPQLARPRRHPQGARAPASTASSPGRSATIWSTRALAAPGPPPPRAHPPMSRAVVDRARRRLHGPSLRRQSRGRRAGRRRARRGRDAGDRRAR